MTQESDRLNRIADGNRRVDEIATLRAEVERLTRREAARREGNAVDSVTIRELRARVASLESVERAARELATWFPFPEHPREVAPSSQADLRREYVKRLTNLLDALAPRSERREGEPCPRCKGLRTVPSSVGVGPLNVPCPECACKRCGGEGIVWDHRNEMPCPACAPAATKEE